MFLIILGGLSFVNVKAQNLEKHSWKNRILLVKASDTTSEIYQEQIKEFENAPEEMRVRKFVLYKMVGETYDMVNFEEPALNDSGKVNGKPIGKSLNDKENFEVILIGLDGGIKLQQTKLLTKEALFNIVDAMPMRRSELNKKID